MSNYSALTEFGWDLIMVTVGYFLGTGTGIERRKDKLTDIEISTLDMVRGVRNAALERAARIVDFHPPCCDGHDDAAAIRSLKEKS